jgi:hypothetical protein
MYPKQISKHQQRKVFNSKLSFSVQTNSPIGSPSTVTRPKTAPAPIPKEPENVHTIESFYFSFIFLSNRKIQY